MKFAAIDFETANYSDLSICATGLAVFEDGKLAEMKYWLVRPPKGFGWFREDWTANYHGLTHLDVRDAPEFPAVAPEIFAWLSAADVVVAHNAQFDMRKLCATAKHFDLEFAPFDSLCTLALARSCWPNPLLANHGLATVAAHIGHQFQHHHAGEDAETAGQILLAMMMQKGISAPRDLAAAGVPLRRVGIAREKSA